MADPIKANRELSKMIPIGPIEPNQEFGAAFTAYENNWTNLLDPASKYLTVARLNNYRLDCFQLAPFHWMVMALPRTLLLKRAPG
jgi:hypothetical protein